MSAEQLPPAVRARVLALASQRLASLAEQAVPPAVRPFRHFTPTKRARLAAPALAASLETDPAFRQSVAEAVDPALARALREGGQAPAAAPEDVGAAAYLLRPDGWPAVLQRSAQELAERERTRTDAATLEAVTRLSEQLEAVRVTARAEATALSEQLEQSRHELAAAQRHARQLGARAAAAERALAAARTVPEPAAPELPRSELPRSELPGPELAGSELAGSELAGSELPRSGMAGPDPAASDPGSEVRRLRARLRSAEQALAAVRTEARAQGRSDRHAEQLRLRALLDALLGAAGGLRRELALAPLTERPADGPAARWTRELSLSQVSAQGRSDDDPARLDALLSVPAVHLLVDGYNVTKTGYGEQTLEVQRSRLLTGLGTLAARTGAETTVVFDGADVRGVRVAAPRGVRLLFSRKGETADDVLRTLVGVEPAGRPLVVVSSDREVAGDVRRAGATTAASRALLALLGR